MNQPLVSVIIAVKNGERFLPAALASVRAQTYRPVELVVVDGKSTDRNAEIARAFPGVRYLLQEHIGLADAWNVGIAAARGAFIAFLDADDEWLPDKLRAQVDYVSRHPAIDYVIAYLRFFIESGETPPAGFKPELLERDVIGRVPGTLLAHKTLFERIGNFKTDLSIASDVDWFARAKDAHAIMAILPNLVLRKRVHIASLSANARLNNDELLKILQASIIRQRNQEDTAR